jgi:hypothetical protein
LSALPVLLGPTALMARTGHREPPERQGRPVPTVPTELTELTELTERPGHQERTGHQVLTVLMERTVPPAPMGQMERTATPTP